MDHIALIDCVVVSALSQCVGVETVLRREESRDHVILLERLVLMWTACVLLA